MIKGKMETKTNEVESKPRHVSNDSIKIPVKWIISVIVLIVLVVLVFLLINSGIFSKTAGTNTEISEKEATDKILSFFATNVPESNVTFISASRQGSLYKITLNVDGQEVPVYVTSDGKYLVVDMIPL